MVRFSGPHTEWESIDLVFWGGLIVAALIGVSTLFVAACPSCLCEGSYQTVYITGHSETKPVYGWTTSEGQAVMTFLPVWVPGREETRWVCTP